MEEGYEYVVLEMLRKGPCSISFLKVNGERRDMRCTLNASYLPEQIVEQASKAPRNADVICVFDLDKSEWRSFRKDSLLRIGLEV